jgi:hypothetical protein
MNDTSMSVSKQRYLTAARNVALAFVSAAAWVSAAVSSTPVCHAAPPKSGTVKAPAFSIHAGKIQHAYLCAPGVKAGKIEDGVVHADLPQGNERYLLIAYSEMSRPSNPNGRCGAADESYLVWLHIHGDTVVEFQSAQYESCWKEITGSTPAWSGQFCSVTYEMSHFDFGTNQMSETHSKATFDAKAPEKGIQIVTDPPKVVP